MKLSRNKRLFIYCAGGQGRDVLKVAKAAYAAGGGWEEIFFVDDGFAGNEVNGIPVLSLNICLDRYGPRDGGFQIASGEPRLRQDLTKKLLAHGRQLETLVHPSLELSPFQDIGEGAFIGEGVVLSDNLSIGPCACLNANSTVGHNSSIGAYSVISPGAIISGEVTIGANTYIGTGAILRDEIEIGRDRVIGMGSLVTKSIPAGVVAYGSPCQIIRENKTGSIFKTSRNLDKISIRGGVTLSKITSKIVENPLFTALSAA